VNRGHGLPTGSSRPRAAVQRVQLSAGKPTFIAYDSGLAAPDCQALLRPVPTTGADQTSEHHQAYFEPGVMGRDRFGGDHETSQDRYAARARYCFDSDRLVSWQPGGCWPEHEAGPVGDRDDDAGPRRRRRTQVLPAEGRRRSAESDARSARVPAQPCKFTDYKQTGNTVTYTMTCTFGKGKPARSAVTATYSGDSTHGTITSATGVQSVIDSRRIDTCTKSSF
jgi:hypothetical protein